MASKLTVSSNQAWTDTQIDVHLGDVVQVRATGGRAAVALMVTARYPSSLFPCLPLFPAP
jgi:hypothetical protein